MGGCYANGSEQQQRLAGRIDAGPWPLAMEGGGDPETSQSEPPDSPAVALGRMLRHHATLQQRQDLAGPAMDEALRCALTHLIGGELCRPPAGTARGLRYLRDRISVPRDMPLHAGRRLRQSLEATACADPQDATAQGPPLPLQHRRDQDPRPFLAAAPGGGQ
jgi:glutathione S-transferase